MLKYGRNDPCPCGSGRKYKHCCLLRAGDAHLIGSRRDTDDPKALHQRGFAAYRAGEYDAAVKLIQKAIRIDRSNAVYLCNLGVVYEASGRKDDAIGSFRSAIEARPDFADAHNNLGHALAGQGELEEALRCFRRALALKPGFALAHIYMGNALILQGRVYEAIACYQSAIAIQSDFAPAHYNLGKAFSHICKLDAAIASYRRAIRLEPGVAEIHNSLGIALMEVGQIEEAVASVRRALILRPDFAAAHFNLHSLVLNPLDLAPSIACLRRVVALTPEDMLARVYLGMLLDYSGDPVAAAEHFALASNGTPLERACLDSYRYIKSVAGTLPTLTGHAPQGFRIAIGAAINEGLVLEFGVNFATSIRQIASLAAQEVHGFDSFEGLPEAWHGEPRGSYTTKGTLPAVPENVFLHQGWFEDTLPPFLERFRGPVRLVHIDCDLYSATRTVLESLAGRIVPGSVIVFDEYFGHEHWREDEFRAFQETVAKHHWRYDYLCFSAKQAVVRIK